MVYSYTAFAFPGENWHSRYVIHQSMSIPWQPWNIKCLKLQLWVRPVCWGSEHAQFQPCLDSLLRRFKWFRIVLCIKEVKRKTKCLGRETGTSNLDGLNCIGSRRSFGFMCMQVMSIFTRHPFFISKPAIALWWIEIKQVFVKRNIEKVTESISAVVLAVVTGNSWLWTSINRRNIWMCRLL